MMYLLVPLVGFIGAAVARFRPDGMARALFVTALAQALVLATVLIVRNPQVTPWTAAVVRGFGANAFFVMVFAGSALLFRKAASRTGVGSGLTKLLFRNAPVALCYFSAARDSVMRPPALSVPSAVTARTSPSMRSPEAFRSNRWRVPFGDAISNVSRSPSTLPLRNAR